MKRTLTLLLVSVGLAFFGFTSSADTHLWLTTEGSGIEVTTNDYRPSPPPPPPNHHRHTHKPGYCKICKKHYKEMKKQAKKHHKDMQKHHKHNKHNKQHKK